MKIFQKILCVAAAALCLTAGGMALNKNVVSANEIPQNGWYQDEGGYWYYYKDGAYLTDFQNIGSATYCFGYNGRMITNTFYGVGDGQQLYIDGNGIVRKNGWFRIGDDYCYADADGIIYNNKWLKYNGQWYFFVDNYMVNDGWVYDEEYDGWYYFQNGVQKGNDSSFKGWHKYGNYWVYYDRAGVEATGWRQIDGVWYYFEPDAHTGYYGHYMYYRDVENYAFGQYLIDDKYYGFDESGAMQTGWVQDYEGYWSYYNKSTGAAAVGWSFIDGKWYYFKARSYAFVGKNYAAMVNGEIYLDCETYYFNPDGSMVTGWFEHNGSWFYLKSNGLKLKSDWLNYNGKWYYFDSYGYMNTDNLYIDGVYYRFNEDGSMVTGWYQDDNNWLYYKDNGAEAKGWLKVGNNWYYFNDRGIMQTGWIEIKGYWYYLGKDGKMWHDCIAYSDASKQYYNIGSDGRVIF